METIKSWECFKRVDGRFQFHRMEGILRQADGQIITARWKTRTAAPEEDSGLENIQSLDTKDRGPQMKPGWTTCPEDFINERNFYIKKPTLMDHLDRDLATRITYDIEACEHLHMNPHPHLATYHGCLISATEYVEGLCFQRYCISLEDACNPRHLNKQQFLQQGPQRSLVFLTTKDGSSASVQLLPGHFGGLIDGIQHLHSLGLVHNDVNPSNIMLDIDDSNPPQVKLILIDFDSCRPRSTSLIETNARRTHPWHDPAVTVSLESNDLDALAEVRVWLFGGDIDQLQG
ncbi:hypothetical protein SEUCBS140593_006389 [Sporothrix eucalyptigena]|uniref:Protein kinase domain-containing protein n=1 Tax=Sporothrix eucalyptigena TaxID=1812306 RepID=A0ABP0C4T6_9PEZI